MPRIRAGITFPPGYDFMGQNQLRNLKLIYANTERELLNYAQNRGFACKCCNKQNPFAGAWKGQFICEQCAPIIQQVIDNPPVIDVNPIDVIVNNDY